MKTCIIEGERVADAAAIYRRLDEAFGFPPHFGNNPDALWDALGDYSGEKVTIVWRDAARLGSEGTAILAVLRKAAAKGWLTLDLA